VRRQRGDLNAIGPDVCASPRPEAVAANLKPEIIHAGDFIYCRSKRYRDSLQLPQEPGLSSKSSGPITRFFTARTKGHGFRGKSSSPITAFTDSTRFW
jgi:hypothetical protein